MLEDADSFLARYYRVITFDPRGNGRSDRPIGANAYDEREFAADAVAVLDATGSDRAVIVGFSMGAQRSLLLATEYPARVASVVFIGPAAPLAPTVSRDQYVAGCNQPRDSYQGWGKYNRHYWLSDYEDFLEFFFSGGQLLQRATLNQAPRRRGGVGNGYRSRDTSRHSPWPGP